MQDWLTAQVQARPDADAIIIEDHHWSYADLNTAVATYTAALAGLGVGRGDKVALLMPNNFAYVCLIHAVMRRGALLIPLNTRLTAEELNWQIEHTNCRAVIHTGQDEALVAALAGCEVISAEDLLAYEGEMQAAAQINLDDPFAIVFTSGTSGRPKGAVLTYGNFFHSAMASAYRLGVLPDDRWLCVLPLYHVGGLSIILRSCLYGTAVDLYQKFDVERINRALQTQPISLISLVPTMLYRLLDAKGETPWTNKLRMVLLGGAAATADLLQRAQAQGVPVATTYGLSEAASQVATASPAEALRKPGTVGKPLMFTHIRIVDAQGKTVPPKKRGEVVVHGPTVMHGYYGQSPVMGDLHTGDIGYIDEDGDLWLVQRRSDLIVSGGENVYPVEVENVLRRHPAVQDACVVGLAHPEWGQQVAAAVILRHGHTVTAESLIEFSRKYLAGYKQPRVVKFMDSLPQTASGKVQRQAVVEQLQNGNTHRQ